MYKNKIKKKRREKIKLYPSSLHVCMADNKWVSLAVFISSFSSWMTKDGSCWERERICCWARHQRNNSPTAQWIISPPTQLCQNSTPYRSFNLSSWERKKNIKLRRTTLRAHTSKPSIHFRQGYSAEYALFFFFSFSLYFFNHLVTSLHILFGVVIVDRNKTEFSATFTLLPLINDDWLVIVCDPLRTSLASLLFN